MTKGTGLLSYQPPGDKTSRPMDAFLVFQGTDFLKAYNYKCYFYF